MAKRLGSGICELCGRERDLTFHHLIPRKLHRRPRFRRDYDSDQLQRGINICRPCHNGLHRLYDEMKLASTFNTREAILQDPALSRHITWSAGLKLQPGKSR